MSLKLVRGTRVRVRVRGEFVLAGRQQQQRFPKRQDPLVWQLRKISNEFHQYSVSPKKESAPPR